MEKQEFWTSYSKLLLSVWDGSINIVELTKNPVPILERFGFTVKPGAGVEIQMAPGTPQTPENAGQNSEGFEKQYDLWMQGETTGKYVLYILESPPQADPAHPALADTCCCCCSCPCCCCT